MKLVKVNSSNCEKCIFNIKDAFCMLDLIEHEFMIDIPSVCDNFHFELGDKND